MGPWAPIPFHPEYEIDKDTGDIRLIKNHQYLYPDKNYNVVIDGVKITIPEVLADTYIGISNLPVIFREPICSKNVTYGFQSFKPYNVGGEPYQPIPGFSRYWISEHGVIFDTVRERFKPIAYNHNGYAVVSLIDDAGRAAPRKVHRMVYLAWVGPLDPELTVDHKDDHKYNNHYTNLQQISAGDNARKAFLSDSNQHANVWTPDDIHTICKLLEKNYSYREIADAINREYDVIRTDFNHLMHRLMTGKSYTNITQGYDLSHYCGAVNKRDSVLNADKVRDIWRQLQDGIQIATIARQYGCTTSTIKKIQEKKTWREITDQL